ncbi:hypothetical protein KO493_02705 [Tamlana agarivorans]|uniref:Uncharacterized protein n=1 Tax=Pseudotamlana agarivorans TaxID=481183 RepID=A0ACC5U5P5_9FLAO|nr:hypothetical protein [Tamlana agarivorans]MBU2949604.1 hypothetical protein [Tamlana agarivorans]
MKTLSKENIKFIDTYLENSGIDFIDIRYEMIDHVASEIEARIENGDDRTFYYIFKDYMAENKSKLLKYNSKYHWIGDRLIWNRLLKKSFSLRGLIIFAAIFMSFNLIELYVSKVYLIRILKDAPLVIMVIIGVFYSTFMRTKNEKYSLIERMGLFFFIVFYGINLFFNRFTAPMGYVTHDLILMKIKTTFLIFILVLLTLCTLEFKKDYHLKYGIDNS